MGTCIGHGHGVDRWCWARLNMQHAAGLVYCWCNVKCIRVYHAAETRTCAQQMLRMAGVTTGATNPSGRFLSKHQEQAVASVHQLKSSISFTIWEQSSIAADRMQ